MKIIYVYRNIKMGFSIDAVFKPIENQIRDKCEVDTIMFSNTKYTPVAIIKNILGLRKYMKDNRDAIIHITGTENYLLPFIKKYKTVVTVHDLGFYTNKKPSVRRFLKYLLWIKTLQFADKITFISEYSKDEAMRLVKCKKNQTVFISNPVNPIFEINNVEYKFNREMPRLLQIGVKSNKNIDRLAEALEGLGCHLHVVGKLTTNQKEILDLYKIKYSQNYNLSLDEIVKEYQLADIVVMVSTYEGFGMPIIEGQSAGKVVVTSNISPMKEVANSSCVIVNPLDVNEIREGIIEAIKNHSAYVAKGNKNVKKYSLEYVSEQYYQIYQQLEVIDNA